MRSVQLHIISLVTTFFFLFSICAFPIIVLADEPDSSKKIATLKKGDKAPFAGTIFSTSAAADLLFEMRNCDEKCALEKKKALELLQAQMQLKIDMSTSAFKALEYKHTELLKVKNDQIKFLTQQLTSPSWYESRELWFVVGVVVGIGVTVGTSYALAEAYK